MAGRGRSTPRCIPLGLLRDYAGLAHLGLLRTAFGGVRPLLYTNRPKARLRDGAAPRRRHGGDDLRLAARSSTSSGGSSDDVLLGAMDMRGLAAPFFFVLHRDGAET